MEQAKVISQEEVNLEIERNHSARVQTLLDEGLSISRVIKILRAEYAAKGYTPTENQPSLSQAIKDSVQTKVIADRVNKAVFQKEQQLTQ